MVHLNFPFLATLIASLVFKTFSHAASDVSLNRRDDGWVVPLNDYCAIENYHVYCDYLFYANCKQGTTDSYYHSKNWMSLVKCLGYDTENYKIIAQENGNFIEKFKYEKKCRTCFKIEGSVIKCTCYHVEPQFGLGEYVTKTFDLNTVLTNHDGDVFCFRNRAQKIEIKPHPNCGP